MLAVQPDPKGCKRLGLRLAEGWMVNAVVDVNGVRIH